MPGQNLLLPFVRGRHRRSSSQKAEDDAGLNLGVDGRAGGLRSIKASDVIADILLNVGRLTVIKSGSVSNGYLFASPAECPAYGLLAFQPDGVPEIRVQRRPRSGFITDMELMLKANHPIAPLPLSRRGVVKIEVTE